MTKEIRVTVDIAIARRILCVAGFSFDEIYQATDDEIFEKVLSMIDCYGATFFLGRAEYEDIYGL